MARVAPWVSANTSLLSGAVAPLWRCDAHGCTYKCWPVACFSSSSTHQHPLLLRLWWQALCLCEQGGETAEDYPAMKAALAADDPHCSGSGSIDYTKVRVSCPRVAYRLA